MSRQIKIVLDCVEPLALARFWAAALDYRIVGSVENYTLLAGEDGAPQLLLQKVDEAKAGKNRMHVDITCADVEGEVTRLLALGACRSSSEVVEHGMHWVVVADPEGNEFCVCGGHA